MLLNGRLFCGFSSWRKQAPFRAHKQLPGEITWKTPHCRRKQFRVQELRFEQSHLLEPKQAWKVIYDIRSLQFTNTLFPTWLVGIPNQNKNNSVNTCIIRKWSKGTKWTWNTKANQCEVNRKEQDEEWDFALELQGMICVMRGVKWKVTNESNMQGSFARRNKNHRTHIWCVGLTWTRKV